MIVSQRTKKRNINKIVCAMQQSINDDAEAQLHSSSTMEIMNTITSKNFRTSCYDGDFENDKEMSPIHNTFYNLHGKQFHNYKLYA
jgi:hypothetical protein